MPEPSISFVDRKLELAIKLYENNVPFTEFPDDLRIVFDRWASIHHLRLKYIAKGDDFVREIHKVTWNIDDTTARQDMRCSEIFHGRTKQAKRIYDRLLRIEFLKKASFEAFAKGKYKESAQYESILQKYLDPAHDPIEMPDFEELKNAVQVQPVFEPELLGVVRMADKDIQILKEKVAKKRNIDFDDAEVIN